MRGSGPDGVGSSTGLQPVEYVTDAADKGAGDVWHRGPPEVRVLELKARSVGAEEGQQAVIGVLPDAPLDLCCRGRGQGGHCKSSGGRLISSAGDACSEERGHKNVHPTLLSSQRRSQR